MSIMHDPVDIERFVNAGNATFTLSSIKTGAHYTYRARLKKKTGQIFVEVLYGRDNTSDYIYIGELKDSEFRLTRGSKLLSNSKPILALNFMCEKVLTQKKKPETVHLEVRHEGKCGKCGRLLTVPESIDRGIGPECAAKMGID
jgi:hypothetical protein